MTTRARIAVAAGALIAALLPSPSFAVPKVLYVSTTGSDSNSCLTELLACLTIQRAITQASSGDTVQIAAGEYVETNKIILDKSLTIIGASMSTTVVRPQYSTTAYRCVSDYCGWWEIRTGATVTLRNLTLDGQESGGTRLSAIRNGVYITGNAVIDTVRVKNIIATASGSLLVSFAIHQGFQGTSPMNLVVRNSIIENFSAAGIQTDAGNNEVNGDGTPKYSSTVTIQNNRIVCRGAQSTDPSHTWANSGVYVTGGTSATVSGNSISGCLTTADYGSGPIESAGVMVESNWASGSSVIAVNNRITDSKYGFYVFYESASYPTGSLSFTGNYLETTAKIGSGNVPAGTAITDARLNYWGQNTGPVAEQLPTPATFNTSTWISTYDDDPSKTDMFGFWPVNTVAGSKATFPTSPTPTEIPISNEPLGNPLITLPANNSQSISVSVSASIVPGSVTAFTLEGATFFDINVIGLDAGKAILICVDGEAPKRLWHYTNSQWVDVTTSYKTDASPKRVCGEVGSFSPFALAAPAPSPLRTVTYDANGGSGSVPASATVTSGDSYTVAANTGPLTREGYIFAGWTTSIDGDGRTYTAGSGTITVVANVTLYAKWRLLPPPIPPMIPNGLPVISGKSEVGETITCTAPPYSQSVQEYTFWFEINNKEFGRTSGTRDRVTLALTSDLVGAKVVCIVQGYANHATGLAASDPITVSAAVKPTPTPTPTVTPTPTPSPTITPIPKKVTCVKGNKAIKVVGKKCPKGYKLKPARK